MVCKLALCTVLLVGCASRPPTAATSSAALTQGAPGEELTWEPFSPETFARAKAEHKFVVLDGSAEWCHWCHVMEATTYHDPTVRALLAKSFLAVKVDIDARPDLAERYGEYGWPATVIFAPDASEIGKYRGYLPPDQFVGILERVAETAPEAAAVPRPAEPDVPLSAETLRFVARFTAAELDDYWDADEGGWGRSQKAPIGCNNAWMLHHGFVDHDDKARAQALFALERQAKLIDPVWGGIYQYSAAKDWDHPHFEKLMTFQAPALENYADAYRFTKDPTQLARARQILGYVERFLRGPDGGFYTTQDADLNAHDRAKPFVDGHTYYALGAKEREARGLPRVDTNEYGRENGLAIAAYVAMYEATNDPAVLATAQRAAAHVLATHHTSRGGIGHVASSEEPKQLFLADNAAFGLALLRLEDVAPEPAHLTAARAIGDFLLRDLADDVSGGLFAATKDPDAVGVFAERRVPFEDNVTALRFLARLHAKTGDARYRHAIARIVRAISTPESIKSRGRWLGDYLLALEESR